MWGLDLETAGRIGEEVKRFQMHNVKRMGEIVLQKSHNLQRIGPTAFNFYQNENRLGGGSPSADTIGAEGNSDSEQTDLNRFSLAGSSSEIQNSSEEGVGEGKQEFVIPDGASEWKGVISSSENERYRCNVEFNLSAEDSEDNEQGLELTLEGFIDIPESRDILLSGEGRTSNGVYEITRLRFHYPDGEEDLQASLETSEYGIELAISDQELEGASKRTGWKSIVLSPKEYDLELSSEDEQSRDHSLIDPDFILESTSIVYTELQDFEMPYKSSRWNVDYSQMPLSRAVSLAEYLIDSTIKKQIFNSEIPTVGGEILTATISYKDGFNFLE
jgi:hypothetical protein